MDDALWQHGEAAARCRQHAETWELDFLRGMHQGSALAELASVLKAMTGADIRLMSIWLDKTAWVSWSDANGNLVNKRELADLAVIVRRKTGAVVTSWMWLLQAKRTSRLLENYQGASATHELDLLHRMPLFTLRGTGQSFDLEPEFRVTKSRMAKGPWNCEVSTPWTFLDFDANRHAPGSAASRGFSPIAPRWTGGVPPQGSWARAWRTQHNCHYPAINSYTRCLEAIIKGSPIPWIVPRQTPLGPKFLPGAPIEDQFPEWSKLYHSLIDSLGGKRIGHASLHKGEKDEIIRLSEFIHGSHALDDWWLYDQHLLTRFGPSTGGIWGEIPLNDRSSFQWSHTLGPDGGTWQAIDRFNKALRATQSGRDGGDGPTHDASDEPPHGMQILIVDVLSETRRE